MSQKYFLNIFNNKKKLIWKTLKNSYQKTLL